MKEKPTSLVRSAPGQIQIIDLRLPIEQGPCRVYDAMGDPWILALESGTAKKAHGFGQIYCLRSVGLSYLV